MAKMKGKGFVLAALAAGAASYLSKKENRDKVTDYLNQAKTKVNENGGVQGLLDKVQGAANGGKAEDAGGPSSSAGVFIGEENKSDEVSTSLDEKLEEVANQANTSSTSELEGNHFVEEGGALTVIDAYNEQQANDEK